MRKKTKKLFRWTPFDTVVMMLATLVCVITLYPMIYVFSCSISDPKSVLAGEVVLYPVGFSLDAYNMVVNNPQFWRSMLNSVFYVVAECILMFLTTVLVAYPLTRPNLKFRKVLTYYLLIPMYFSGGMIPAYLVICNLGLYNSPWSLVLPGCYGIWNIILCRTFMASLPQELIDSALIDGSDQFRAFLKIVIPLSKPVMAVIMIYTIVGTWNAWFGASIYTTNRDIQPVQLYMRHVLAATSTSMQSQMLEQLPEELRLAYQKKALAAN